jgi:uncharacterized membrane protein YphA (DoxX/SURF4 family)
VVPVVAGLLSIVLFLAFLTSGAQKVQFNPMMSAVANRLGYSKASYRRFGVIEILGGFGILVGLASTRGSFGGVLNEASAGVLALMMAFAVVVHLRKGDEVKGALPALALGALAILAALFRLA